MVYPVTFSCGALMKASSLQRMLCVSVFLRRRRSSAVWSVWSAAAASSFFLAATRFCVNSAQPP